MRRILSKNVVGIGSKAYDPKLKDECIVYTAHWDHLGKDDKSLKGDPIYNGAADNASGVAMMLEIAEAYTRLHDTASRGRSCSSP